MKSITHWKLTRITSVPLALLFFYFLAQAEYLASRSPAVLISWIKAPFNTFALLVFVVCGFWHAQLGMEEIIIDYVSSDRRQKLCLCLNKLFFFVLGAACLYATLAISFRNF